MTQSQSIVWFLVPSQTKTINNSTESQNNLKPMGPQAHCWEDSKIVLSAPALYFPGGADKLDWTGPGSLWSSWEHLDYAQLGRLHTGQWVRQPHNPAESGKLENQGHRLPLFPTSQKIKSKLAAEGNGRFVQQVIFSGGMRESKQWGTPKSLTVTSGILWRLFFQTTALTSQIIFS